MKGKNILNSLANRTMNNKKRKPKSYYHPNNQGAYSLGTTPNDNAEEEQLNEQEYNEQQGIQSSNENEKEEQDIVTKVNGLIKFFKIMKIVLPIILVGCLVLGFVIFIVIICYNEEENQQKIVYGNYKYGTTCTKVTVTDTKNKIYDGEVEFDKYIAGVVAAEVENTNINDTEYYKLLATTYRTYFVDTVGDNCTVSGNSSFLEYMDVDDSRYKDEINQANEDTKNMIIIEGEKLLENSFMTPCVVNVDTEYYYLKYANNTSEQSNIQKIPKTWVTQNKYSSTLDNIYNQVDKSETNYEARICPTNTGYGMSKIGAHYLITEEGYTYQNVIKYYYGEDTSAKENLISLRGVEGFINPTRKIYCSSPFGYRTDPITGKGTSYHSGIDIAIAGGEPVFAAKAGTVTTVTKGITAINVCASGPGNGYGYGNHVIIDHGDGTATVYAHMKGGSVPDNIVKGTKIEQGQQIGAIGSTGCSTGNHLHYEVRVNGNKVDPADYLDLTEASGRCRQ